MDFLKRVFQGTTQTGQAGQSGQAERPTRPQAVQPRQAQALIDADQPPFLLDVRERHEFAAGHIPGAQLIPLGELEKRLNELPTDQPILCICRSGSRSGAAANLLARRGLQTINLTGGMIGWAGAGLPVKRGNGK
ncbi:MAG: rhodanese-like domain-containing protein [Anaerolineae bacterium]|nr:rhodanese-like domain-containing protein [Anaerolineae bacterium]